MDSFEVILPKLLNIPLFSDFSKGTEDDLRIMKMVYDNISIKKYKKGDIIIKGFRQGRQQRRYHHPGQEYRFPRR